MRPLIAAVFLLTTISLSAQDDSKDFVYSAYKDPNLKDDLNPMESFKRLRHLFRLPLNEVDLFDFEENYGAKLGWDCKNELGRKMMGESIRTFLGGKMSEDQIRNLIKGTVVLSPDERNQIWKGPGSGPRVYCSVEIQGDATVRELSGYFRQYAGKKLDLPWYEGLLSEALPKFSLSWTLGKTAFDLFLERKPADIMSAASLTALIAKGGELRRVVYFDVSNWDYFEAATEYSVQVGKNDKKTNFVLYSIVYKLNRK